MDGNQLMCYSSLLRVASGRVFLKKKNLLLNKMTGSGGTSEPVSGGLKEYICGKRFLIPQNTPLSPLLTQEAKQEASEDTSGRL